MNLSPAFTQIGLWFAELAVRLLPPGGTTGQVLKKQSDDDFDTAWGAAGGLTVIDPLTGVELATTRLKIVPGQAFGTESGTTISISMPAAGTNGVVSDVLDRESITACCIVVDSDDPIDVELQAINYAGVPAIIQVGAAQGRFVLPLGHTWITQGEPVTGGPGATIEARSVTAAFAVFGQMAATIDIAPFFYSGLKVSLMKPLERDVYGSYGYLQRFGGTATNQIVPSLRPLGSEMTYAEFTLGGTAARAGFRPDSTESGDIDQLGETGSFVSLGFQVDPGDTSQLLVYSESTLVATLAGTADLTTQRLGVLLDPVAQQLWVAADGVWLTLVPGTDPGVSWAALGAEIYFSVSPALFQDVNFYWRPGLIIYATEATAAGAARIGWGAP